MKFQNPSLKIFLNGRTHGRTSRKQYAPHFFKVGGIKSVNIRIERTTCIKKGFWSPLKPKIESYFTTFSLDCFIRCLTQVFLFHVDLTSMVAMVTENGRKYDFK